MTQNLDLAKAIAVSVLFHLLLVLWMFKTVIEIHPEAPVFTELSLGQLSSETLERILEREAQKRVKQMEETPTQRVKLPQRRMLEIEEPTISVPKERKLSAITSVSDEKPVFVPESSPYALREAEIPSVGKKQSLPERKIHIGIEPGKGVEAEQLGSEVQVAFKIEGDIESREILEKVLPSYPPDVQKEATIKIRFTVLPNGTVSDMRPLQKGDTKLENLALRALKQWRFNALQENQEQKPQTGTITFVYRLK